MKKLAFLLTMLLLGALALSACAQPTVEPEVDIPEVEEPDETGLPDLSGREVTIAVENQYLPFNFVVDGVAQGWDYDTLTEICNRINCTPVFVEFGWDTMIASVADGQFDIAADGITITEERAKSVAYSIPYLAFNQKLLVGVDSTISSPDAFAADTSLIVGEQIGTTNYDAAVELLGTEDRVIGFDTFPFAVQALIAGDVDGVVMDDVAGLGYQGANPEAVKLLPQTFRAPEELGFIYPLGSDLVAPFDEALQSMKDDGTLEAISAKWYDPSLDLSYDLIDEIIYEGDTAALGTADNPIQLLFVPSVNVDYIVESGDAIEELFADATGLVYEVSVPTSYAATLEEMCASPTNTIGFIPAMGYALANGLCGVEPAVASSRFGWNVYWAQYLVARDSDIQTLEDLEGKTWGYGDTSSTSGYLVPLAELTDLGITPGEQVETGGHTASARSVYLGEVDFATTFFSPPLLPEGTWALGDPPDIPDDLLSECAVTEEDRLYCGGMRVLDARAGIREEAPDVIQKVRILAISPEIPNDTMSWSPDFPDELKQPIIDALVAFLATDACQVDEITICSEDFYGWKGVGPIADENFDGIRILMEQQGISLENIGE